MNPVAAQQIDTDVCLPWSPPVQVEAMDVTAEGERDATRLVHTTGRRGFAVEPEGVANRLGVLVVGAELDRDMLGGLLMEPGEDPRIVLNTRDGFIRQRLTCAYELGHYLRRSGDPGKYGRIDRRPQQASAGEDPENLYASEFCARFLMPEEDIRILVELGMDDLDMALRFVVSREAVQARLRSMGLELADRGAVR
jgi:Zn-dependent peptidase ImmA (M78 family)